MKKTGKTFENNFKKSVNNDTFFYRFRDGTASWGQKDNPEIRFQQKNACDCLIFNGKKLFLCELKAHKGKNLPISCIRDNQIKELTGFSKYNNVICSIIVFFVDVEECYSMDIIQLNDFINQGERKSIPLSYFKDNCKRIECSKIKVNYRYNIEKWLNEF